jgi:hypothetical protein
MRTAIAIGIWSSLPIMFSVMAALAGQFRTSAVFAMIAGTALAAAFLARTSRKPHVFGSVALLAVLSIPFAATIVARFVYGFGRGVLRVADAPLGFVIGAVTESLFAVPLAAFALSIWRHRNTT